MTNRYSFDDFEYNNILGFQKKMNDTLFQKILIKKNS